MILLVFHKHWIFLNPTMEESAFKLSNSDSTTSLPSVQSVLKNYPVLSRCNSFSSTSSDSAVYCNSQMNSKNYKRPACVDETAAGTKRKRNSSGSSISSSLSYVSDKDLKSFLQPSNNEFVCENTDENGNSPSLGSNELKSKTNNLSEVKTVPVSEHSVVLPPKRILRRQITKKTCTCCPSTQTTVVVRRYQEIVKTSKKKTVISSTKVKTYVQESTVSNAVESNEDLKILPKPAGPCPVRKRRSEIEKLYDSLHEIDWAKNFSPDNILRQINVRQAASCSMFGSYHAKTNSSSNKKPRKPNSTVDILTENVTSPSPCSGKCVVSPQNEVSTVCKLSPDDGKLSFSEAESRLITSKAFLHKPTETSCDSQSAINITCSVSQINIKELKVNDAESIELEHFTVNGSDCLEDVQLSCVSDESSSALSSCIVNRQSKQLINLDFKIKDDKGSSDINSELSVAPAFIDIAEEGIRTIDACFRGVGAEVVVSTCHDESSVLSSQDIAKNCLTNTDPCGLENGCEEKVEISCDEKKTISKNSSENQSHQSIPMQKLKNINSFSLNEQGEINNTCEAKTFNKCISYSDSSRNKDEALLIARRRILKKYLKFLHSVAQPKLTLKFYPERNSGSNEKFSVQSNNNLIFKPLKYFHATKLIDSSKSCNSDYQKMSEDSNLASNNSKSSYFDKTYSESSDSMSDNGCDILNVSRNLIPYDSSMKPSSSYSLALHLPQSSERSGIQDFSCQLKTEKCHAKMYKRDFFDSSQASSFMFNSLRSLKHKNKFKAIVTSKMQSVSQEKIISFVPAKNKVKKQEEAVCRPISSAECSFSYQTIKVLRYNTYSQITLKLTRARSIFLTVQTLQELSDAINRIGNDPNCKIMILNGIGEAFCLGVDLKSLIGPRKNLTTSEMAVAIKDCIEALSHFKKPLAVVVNGAAIGLGMTILNHADFVLASDTATFCMPNVFLGYMPEGGATLTLPQVVGSTIAMDLLLRGRQLSAHQALNVGLVSEVVKSQCLPEELVSKVKTFAGGSLAALETTKSILKMQLHVNLTLVLENEVKLLPRMWLTKSCQDAMRKALCSGLLSQ